MSTPYTTTPPPHGPVPAGTQRPLWKMKRTYAGGLLIMALGFGCGGAAASDDAVPAAKPSPGPTVTETVTATATTTATPAPKATVTEPGPTVTVRVTRTETADTYDSGESDSGSGGDADVYYENCTAARAAGAAPVHRGEPGYGSHLDRDNDGTGCDGG
ncbi:hypothetical protein GCM10010271_39870 [Streptomyces kurssanovii]|nr:hypothetical protein GCM10010271_39870 [Streptomyces kurssanovii]